MAKFGRKGVARDLIFSKATLVLILCICGYLAVSVYERYRVERDMAGRLESANEEYQALESRRDSLLERVEYLEGESGIESEIRKHFDVAREGEQVVIIVDDEEGSEPSFVGGTDPTVDDGKPWYQFW